MTRFVRARALAHVALTIAVTVAAGVVAVPGTAAAQTSPRRPVPVSTEVRPDTVRLGDPVTLRYRIWLPKGATVSFPARPADDSTHHWTDWKVETVSGNGGQREHRLTASLQPFALGAFALPGVPMRFRIAGEEPREGRFPTAWLVIVPTVPLRGPEPPLKDLKPIVPPPWWALVPWLWIAVGLAALALVIFLVRRWLKRRRKPLEVVAPQVPLEAPEIEARRRLEALVARRLPEAGKTLEHGTELADLLHRFVERRFGAPQPGDTTSELARRLIARGFAAVSDVADLRGILEACDLTKFARRPYDAPRAHEAEGTASRLIDTWAPAPAEPVSATANEPPGPAAPGTPTEGAA
ncbi:MAG: hypothetical protein ACREOU_08545 [Candidatus Eiseniibacteriota bacterium]